MIMLANLNPRLKAYEGTGGEFPDTLTLTPSVDAGCWHGYIQNGQIV